MSETKVTTKSKKFHHLNEFQRGKIEVLLEMKYSSWERGTNERQNGLVRFFIPKGTAISQVSDLTLQRTEDWINTIPRKIFAYRNSKEFFNEQISLLT